MAEIKFGVRVPNSGPLASVDNIVRAARSAEELGFDSVWLHDHVIWSSEMHRHHISSGSAGAIADEQTADFFESLTTFSYLAALTSRVDIGIACLVLPCRNPIYAAKQLATADHLSGGRLIAGVGLGSKATETSNEFEVFGVPFSKRAALADEHLDAMAALWGERLASFDGPTLSFKDAEMFPKPLQRPRPRVWVGGWTAKAAERAAIRGDGWIPGWLSPAEMAQGRSHLLDVADAHGRDGSSITIAVEKLAAIAPDRSTALDRALPTVTASRHTYERDVNDIDFALDRHIFGSVDDVRRRVGEFVEAGVTHFELKLIYTTLDEMEEQMALFGEEVIPHYR